MIGLERSRDSRSLKYNACSLEHLASFLEILHRREISTETYPNSYLVPTSTILEAPKASRYLLPALVSLMGDTQRQIFTISANSTVLTLPSFHFN